MTLNNHNSRFTNHDSRKRVGITGQPGFMGTHLYNFLGLKENIERIPFKDEFFSDKELLNQFVSKCDVIVHLAAMNRHGDPQVIYDTNIKLVQDLLQACNETNSKPHIVFSSSTQENRDNLYGKSKSDGRKLFEEWAKKNNSKFTAMIIPNVFGPYGNPYYNSVIATFSHQLTHNETPQIDVDGEMKLIYINELVDEFYNAIIGNHRLNQDKIEYYEVPCSSVNKVSSILEILQIYKAEYFEKGIIPELNNSFELALFNTFRCYFPNDKFPFLLTKNTDTRGSFIEILRAKIPGQYSYSTTKPGITRGNHYHTRKIERFAVISGKATIKLRRIGTEEVITYNLDGESPSFVDMPIWTTHNIANIGETDLFTLFWINEPYNPEDPDTYFEKV